VRGRVRSRGKGQSFYNRPAFCDRPKQAHGWAETGERKDTLRRWRWGVPYKSRQGQPVSGGVQSSRIFSDGDAAVSTSENYNKTLQATYYKLFKLDFS